MDSKSLRIVFMGTPAFAVAALKELLTEGFTIVGIITTPDKPAGRGQHVQESAVKQFAKEYPAISIFQPLRLKDPEFIQNLASLNADLFVVVAFRMLPQEIWNMPPLGTINLHASLLPQYRGAAPINWAIINGETKTGVTTFFIEKEIDTGKIIDFSEVEIRSDENAGELHDKLMHVGAVLLKRTIVSIASKTCNTCVQMNMLSREELKSAPKLYKENCCIQWNNPLDTIYNFIRGLSPSPAAWTTFVKLDNSHSFTAKILIAEMENEIHTHQPGTVFTDDRTFMKVSAIGGYLHIRKLQAEGKKPLDSLTFLRGFKNAENYRLI